MMGLSVLPQLHCASPTTELTSKDETSVEWRAEVCVPIHEHTGTSLPPLHQNWKGKSTSYPKLFPDKPIKKAKEQIFKNEYARTSLSGKEIAKQ